MAVAPSPSLQPRYAHGKRNALTILAVVLLVVIIGWMAHGMLAGSGNPAVVVDPVDAHLDWLGSRAERAEAAAKAIHHDTRKTRDGAQGILDGMAGWYRPADEPREPRTVRLEVGSSDKRVMRRLNDINRRLREANNKAERLQQTRAELLQGRRRVAESINDLARAIEESSNRKPKTTVIITVGTD